MTFYDCLAVEFTYPACSFLHQEQSQNIVVGHVCCQNCRRQEMAPQGLLCTNNSHVWIILKTQLTALCNTTTVISLGFEKVVFCLNTDVRTLAFRMIPSFLERFFFTQLKKQAIVILKTFSFKALEKKNKGKGLFLTF